MEEAKGPVRESVWSREPGSMLFVAVFGLMALAWIAKALGILVMLATSGLVIGAAIWLVVRTFLRARDASRGVRWTVTLCMLVIAGAMAGLYVHTVFWEP